MSQQNDNEFIYKGKVEEYSTNMEEYVLNKRRSESVVKSNDLIEASYKLNLNEQRLILYMASKINREDTEFRTVRVTVKEFAETFELDYKNIYKEIKRISKSLTSKSIYIKPPKADGEYMYIAWLSSVHYKNGVLELEFSSRLRPYLLELSSNFSQYQLGDFVKFTSTYSIRLYQLLKRYVGFRDGSKYYSIEEFRKIFVLEEKYSKYSNLKRRVLAPAIEEINKVSDITIDMIEDKEGKRVRGLQFKAVSKKTAIEPQVKEEKSDDDVNKDLIITVKTLLQTCVTDAVVEDKDAIALLREAKNDISVIMQKIMLVQRNPGKIENIIGLLIDSIRNNYQAIERPATRVETGPNINYMDSSEKDDFELLAIKSRQR